MSVVKSVTIDGMWGQAAPISFKFYSDVNFIIGVNGTGKTTVINLIAAALQGDFSALDRANFKKIEITLEGLDKKVKKPVIEITRRQEKKSRGNESIIYRMPDIETGEAIEFDLNEYSEEMHRRTRERMLYEIRPQRYYSLRVQEALRKVVKVSWLSVHRTTMSDSRESKTMESPVDVKLAEVLSDLGKYFSTLDKLLQDRQDEFQENIFLSLLYDEKINFGAILTNTDDAEQNHADLEEIFAEFKLNSTTANARIAKHFKKIVSANADLKIHRNLDFNNLGALVLNNRIKAIIAEWKKFQLAKENIYESKTKFKTIVNHLFQRKEVDVNDKNEVIIRTKTDNLAIGRLSSGEKQLLIVLGQALLQQGEQWVYIADEPELSLHVRWQETLVSNLRLLNPKAQIIFATHSPDIVSDYSDQVFDMEKIIK